MNNAQKKGLFTFILELLKLVFHIGSKHVEKHLNENENAE